MGGDVRKNLLMDLKTDRLTGAERTVLGMNGQTLLQTNRPWSKLTYTWSKWIKLKHPNPLSATFSQTEI